MKGGMRMRQSMNREPSLPNTRKQRETREREREREREYDRFTGFYTNPLKTLFQRSELPIPHSRV